MFNYLAKKFRDPTPISIPNEKPIEALSDDEIKLSVELPNEETLKDELTEARGKGEAEATVGAAQQTPSQSVKIKEYIPEVPSNLHVAQSKLDEQPSLRAGKPLKSEHIKVLNGMVETPDKVKNVNRKAKENLPSKLCNGSMTNDMPSAHALLLKGEQHHQVR
ncbi:hypothetical protein EV401DRAFT_1882006 [Pisolithus croceorrhizus]|nr:hypothetical protein EV401DRAFT_1882006 [Pisolithus croceorrhizus]